MHQTSWKCLRAQDIDILDGSDSLQAWPQHTHGRAASAAAQGVAGGLTPDCSDWRF